MLQVSAPSANANEKLIELSKRTDQGVLLRYNPRFGLPPSATALRPGYNPRNRQCPRQQKRAAVIGEEPYLKQLAQKTGLTCTHLTDEPEFLAALRAHARTHPVTVAVARSPIAAALGLPCLVGVFVLPLLRALLGHGLRLRASSTVLPWSTSETGAP